MIRGAGAVLALLGAVGAADDEADVVQALDRFISAVAKKDPDAALAAWSPGSPQKDSLKADLEAAIAYESKPARSAFEYSHLSIDGDQASLRFSFAGRWTRQDERYDDEARTLWQVHLRREGGIWKWWIRVPRAEVLARMLLVEADPEVRQQYLAGFAEAVGRRLAAALHEAAVESLLADRREEALSRADLMMEAAKSSGRELHAGLAHLGRGELLVSAGKAGEALEDLEQARARLDACGAVKEAVRARNSLSFVYGDLRRSKDAVDVLDRALKDLQGIEDPESKAETEIAMGVAKVRAGRPREAQDWQRRAIETARSPDLAEVRARAWAHLGDALVQEGKYSDAEHAALLGSETLGKLEDPMTRARLANVRGQACLYTGRPVEAIAWFEESLKVWQATGNSRLKGILRLNLGEARRRGGGAEELASADFEASLRLLEAAGDGPMVALARNGLGMLARGRRDHEQALIHYERGLEAAVGDEGKSGRLYLRSNRAELLLSIDPGKAVEAFRELQRDMGEGAAAPTRYLLHLGVGRALLAAGSAPELRSALAELEAAADCLETMRGGLRSADLRRSFLAEHASIYSLIGDVHLDLKRAEPAFASTERAKARTLLEVRFGEGTDAGGSGEETRLKGDYAAAVARRVGARTPDQIDEAEAGLQAARTALSEFRLRLEAANPGRSFFLARYSPAPVREIHEAVIASGTPTLFLSYQLGSERTILHALACGPAGSRLESHALIVPRPRLERLAEEFWRNGSQKGAGAEAAAAELGEVLLPGAVVDLLKSHPRLVVVPDGALHLVPFAALRVRGSYLVEQGAVGHAPSVTAWLAMTRLSARRRREPPAYRVPLLAVGNPATPSGQGDLPTAEEDARTIARRAGGAALIGTEATKSRVKAELPGARRILLATHAKVDEDRPFESYVRLAPEGEDKGLLTAAELSELRLTADLMTLAACETGRGKSVPGDGLLGMTWAVFASGVPSTVVSLWQIEDRSAGALTRAFHEALDDRAYAGAPEALAAAQRKLLGDPETRHPYYWAPFVLVGSSGK